MNFTFMAQEVGACSVTLWATGRYGFSLPKKIEIRAPDGEVSTFLYFNRKLRLQAELNNRAIVRLAIAVFLSGVRGVPDPVELDTEMPPFEGKLTQVRSQASRAPLRVRPGKPHARARPGGGAGTELAPSKEQSSTR